MTSNDRIHITSRIAGTVLLMQNVDLGHTKEGATKPPDGDNTMRFVVVHLNKLTFSNGEKTV